MIMNVYWMAPSLEKFLIAWCMALQGLWTGCVWQIVSLATGTWGGVVF